MSTAFLQGLIRRLSTEPAVTAAWVGGSDGEQIDLYLVAAPGFRAALAAWLGSLGELAYSGPDGEGWRAVTPDGVEWRFRFAPPASPAGLQSLFDRREAGENGPAPSEAIDLAAMAGRFWADLYRAARALGQGRPFTAHGHLEECRRALLDLYRLALAPGEEGHGWEAIESLPGVGAALEQVREWLVAPLDLRAQWRAAHRLAATYEPLMLPLCERLGVAYPMPMRNLAFGRLEQARPDRAPAEALPRQAEPLAEPAAPARPGRLRVAKGRLRRP